MSAAAAFRRRDVNASDAIAELLHPNMGYREKLRQRGVEPKDYERANRLRLKRQQAEQRARKQAEAAAKPEAFKLAKFKSVQPRVFQEKICSPDDADRPVHRDFLRRGAKSSALHKTNESKPTSTHHSTTVARVSAIATTGSACNVDSTHVRKRSHLKPPIPSRQELEQVSEVLARLNLKEKTDFVTSNAWDVIKAAPAQHVHDEEKNRPKHDSYGRVPEYLLQRKELWAREEEERRRNMPDPNCPPGMVPMDEGERLKTLSTLQQSLEQAQYQVARLPLRVETMSQIRRKDELLARLQEIEDAIRVFNKPKVYIAKTSNSASPRNGTCTPGSEHRRFRRSPSSQKNASAA